jgi:hypothetical protein
MHHSGHNLDIVIVLKVEEKGGSQDERGAWRGFDSSSGLREMYLYRRRRREKREMGMGMLCGV